MAHPELPPQKRIQFPFRGATDRAAYIETPGDAAPFGTLLNVRPRESIGGRERGGQRPGLARMTDTAGVPWPQLPGPIKLIKPLARAAQVTGFQLGAAAATHIVFDSRSATETLIGNLFTLRGRGSRLSMSRNASIGNFANPLHQNCHRAIWTGPRQIAGAVNLNLANAIWSNPSEPLVDLIFRSEYAAGQPNSGFGTPGWEALANWDDGTLGNTNSGPWPTLDAGIFYGEDHLYIAGMVTASRPPDEPWNKGFLAVYDLADGGTDLLAVAAGENPYRPYAIVYHEATPGDPETLQPGGLVVNGGAIQIHGIACKTIGSERFVYFTSDAARRIEATVGRINVTSVVSTGLTLETPGSGGFQVNGAAFAFHAGTFVVPSDPLSPHFLSVNYPRGGRPMDVDVDPMGFIYFVQSSSGEGLYVDPAAPAYRPDHHPDFAGHKPITVCKVDPFGVRFEWESVTHYRSDESGYQRINDPELTWVKADELGCYCGGREINSANVFAINSATGGIRWKWRSCAAGAGLRIRAARIDPESGHLWVVGDRSDTWQGVTGGRFANVWLLHKVSGMVLQDHDLGVGTDALSIDINPETGLVAIGTRQTDS